MNLKDKYKTEIIPNLQKELNIKNIMAIPKITKIVINRGIGESINDKKILDQCIEELLLITGQKPIITKAKKSIAGFKVREGFPIGCKVTLRNEKMWNFLDKLINIAIPRIRDFRGLNPKSFDKFGNYTFGLKEQIIFPEIDFDKISKLRGMDITINTKAKSTNEARSLLKNFGIPFLPFKE